MYGYFLPANQRVGLSVPQVCTTLTTLFAGTAINISMFKDSESFGDIQWGSQSKVGTYAIFLLAISFTWLMGLMGYIRSSVRLFWHVTEVVRDNSADAYTLKIWVKRVKCLPSTLYLFGFSSLWFSGWEFAAKKPQLGSWGSSGSCTTTITIIVWVECHETLWC
ncbi:MAG: hypothetical protein Ct9H300mP23_02840 [Nitrospinota bacterium]|nr:MAG: hypothetical protein Ct9H300mP23_02840 [Nitrospinota bacterium]